MSDCPAPITDLKKPTPSIVWSADITLTVTSTLEVEFVVSDVSKYPKLPASNEATVEPSTVIDSTVDTESSGISSVGVSVGTWTVDSTDMVNVVEEGS